MNDDAEGGAPSAVASEQALTPAPSAAPSAAPSPTPSSEPTTDLSGSPKETLLDAVLKVVPATTETDVLADPKDPASPETPPEETPADGQAEASPEDDDDSEPAADAASPLIRRKINKLLKQRRELRAELDSSRPMTEIGSQMDSFARQNDLSGDDVANVLKMAAMLRKGDYSAFYQAVAPFVRTAQEYLGIALPKDLQDRVGQGHMTEDAAREFARNRMDNQRLQVTRSEDQRRAAQSTLQMTQDQVQRSVTAFEERISANDPDYKAKAASVRRTAQAMLFERGGSISTVQEAIDITKAAYDEVNAAIRKQRPPPQATSKLPNGNGQTRTARPEPTSLMEAALQGLANARNGAGHP